MCRKCVDGCFYCGVGCWCARGAVWCYTRCDNVLQECDAWGGACCPAGVYTSGCALCVCSSLLQDVARTILFLSCCCAGLVFGCTDALRWAALQATGASSAVHKQCSCLDSSVLCTSGLDHPYVQLPVLLGSAWTCAFEPAASSACLCATLQQCLGSY
jgi:hypothetical protein